MLQNFEIHCNLNIRFLINISGTNLNLIDTIILVGFKDHAINCKKNHFIYFDRDFMNKL